MAQTFNDGETGAAVRGKINTAITELNSLTADVAQLEYENSLRFGTVADLLADTTLNPAVVLVGSVIEAGGFRYEVAASGASDHHVTTAGGVKLYVCPVAGGMDYRAFGVVGDGVADDTAALIAAEAAAFAAGLDLCGPAATCRVTSTITLRVGGNLSQLSITADGSAVSPVVRFGTASGSPVTARSIMLPRVANSARVAGTWGAGVGVELANCNACDIYVPRVTDFAVGVTAGGYNSGFAYNTVSLGYIYSNRVNLRLQPAASTGWCNQNTWIGGRFGINTGDFTVSGYSGTRNILLAQNGATNGGPNNNTFITPSLETDLLEYMIEFSESASYNQFINGRYEGSAKNVLWQTNTAAGLVDNVFIGGYQVNQLVHTFTGTGTALYNGMTNARQNDIDATGYAFNITNRSSAAETAPHLQGFGASVNPMTRDQTATDWSYRLYANGLSGKRSTDTAARVIMDFQNARMTVGDGTAAPTTYVGRIGANIGVNANFVSDADVTRSLGSSTNRWVDVFASQVRPGAGTAIWTSGTGTPEGVVTAPRGSLFTRTDGGANTTLYVKESGTGNTGWVAK